MTTEKLGDKTIELFTVSEFIPQKNEEAIQFVIPGYQRGYRWTRDEVLTLIKDLNDYFANNSNMWYSLQVVVAQNRPEGGFYIVDGQQRMTTIFLLHQAIALATKIIQGEDLNNVSPVKNIFAIQYSTRDNSATWMEELIRAFMTDYNGRQSCKDMQSNKKEFGAKDPDRYHFAEVFYSAMEVFEKYKEDELATFKAQLCRRCKIVWYNLSNLNFQESPEEVFNRLNATKISLNNAELLKALLLQDANFKTCSDELNIINRDRMANEWNRIENGLQDNDFWGFIYSTRHGLKYSTRIEYLFDLMKGKTVEKIDQKQFTFDAYYQAYRELKTPEERNHFAEEQWNHIKNLYARLKEWERDRCLYHYVGYLLEYGKIDGKEISILCLVDRYKNWKKDEIKNDMADLIGDSINFDSNQIVYEKRQNLKQILFLFNVLEENNRENDYARFSFWQYKQIDEKPGWNMEHVASHVDYTIKAEDKGNLACSLLEYLLGLSPLPEYIYKLKPNEIKEASEFAKYKESYEKLLKEVNADMKNICEQAFSLFDIDCSTDKDSGSDDLKRVMDAIEEHFSPEGSDQLVDNDQYKQKNFVWNFVLLNASTNKSYGNHIFPIKRQRIISDDSLVYTPWGTRCVFDKTYCTKLNDFMKWGLADATLYWERIKTVLMPYKRLSDPDFFKLIKK